MKSLFVSAKANKPAIIFVDEVDALCNPQSKSENATAQTIKTEFLVQMLALRADTDGIAVLGATNIPWKLDRALQGSFEKRVHIPLPDTNARRRMFDICIGNTPTSMNHFDYLTLSHKTEGYSGEGIGILVKEALMMPLRKVQAATHFKKVCGPSPTNPECTVDDLLTPCAPLDFGAIEMNWTEVKGDKLLEPKVSLSDFYKSQLTIPSTIVGPDDLMRFEKFTNGQFDDNPESGSDGGKDSTDGACSETSKT